MTAFRIPIEIPVEPWYIDHCFFGRNVLPAVETMLLLAAQTARSYPGVAVRVMEQVTFPKFLEIAPGQATLSGLIEIDSNDEGSVRATLTSKVRLKACTQVQTHGHILFPRTGPGDKDDSAQAFTPLSGAVTTIEATRIYRDLIPFGPGYRTLQGTLACYEQGAVGSLQAPARTPADGRAYKLIGSPFPLDGALHAACAYGQQWCDFIPFPVGFNRRIIARPTRPGDRYGTQIELLSRTNDELVFNLWIYTEGGQVCEAVSRVRMRDVSKAKIKPPVWIRSLFSPRPTASP